MQIGLFCIHISWITEAYTVSNWILTGHKSSPKFHSKSILAWALDCLLTGRENVHLFSASKDSIDVIGKFNLHVRIVDSLTKATFHILDKLAVNILLVTSFINDDILGKLRQSKKLVPCKSKPVSILAQ